MALTCSVQAADTIDSSTVRVTQLKEQSGRYTQINAISADGKVIGTYISKPLDSLWTGENWQNQVDLGVLGSKEDEQKSYVFALNHNGTARIGKPFWI